MVDMPLIAPSSEGKRLRLLMVNSNTSQSVTTQLADRVSTLGWPIDVSSATAPFGAAYVEGRAEVTIAAHATLVAIANAVQRSSASFDACVIGCFGEPGLFAARELFHFPVVGLAEAAMLTAAQIAPRYAILTRSERWPAMLSELAVTYGQSSRCAGAFSLARLGLDVHGDKEKVAAAVADVAVEILEKTDAGALVLGGAALTGLASFVQTHVPVPVVDALAAAVGQACLLARLGLAKATRGSYAAPGSRRLIGIDEDLAAQFR